jgi:hypothetical protein
MNRMASTCFIRCLVMLIEGRTVEARERMDTGGTRVSELTPEPTFSALCENCVKTYGFGKKGVLLLSESRAPNLCKVMECMRISGRRGKRSFHSCGRGRLRVQNTWGGESPVQFRNTRNTGVDEFSETYLIGEAPRFASTEKSEEKRGVSS